MSRVTDPMQLQFQVQQFLNEEANILEAIRLRDWLALLTEDVVYRMPVRQSVQPGFKGANEQRDGFFYFDDDKKSLELRVARLETGAAHAEIPVSVTQRMISNVLVKESDKSDEVEVDSSFHIYQERRASRGYTFMGKRHDRLRYQDGKWRIARRDIRMTHVLLPTTISIFF